MSMQDLLQAQLTKNMLGTIVSVGSLERFLNQGGAFQQKQAE